jgi:hypothetical protein
MGFLDNSGDIILDAVLTDAGRERLARGDGSFKVIKFALGDDEINYGNYNKSAASTSKDLEILQTPVLEAFTNNTSLMKSKLITITRTDLLYLPVIKLNGNLGVAKYSSEDVVLVTSDETTTANMTVSSYLNGYDILGGKTLRVDQGLDTNATPPTIQLDSDLVETQYIVEVDNRLGMLYSPDGTPTPVSFVDDDSIASYFFSRDDLYVRDNLDTSGDNNTQQVIEGPRGTYLNFKIRVSQNLRSSTYLFDLLGETFSIGSTSYKYIDTNIRISGATTGYSLSVPVRFIKQN